jgi:drug/metabolite transporter (DMT)-like permease
VRRASTLRLALLALTWGSSFLWIALALPMLAASWLTVVRLVLGAATLGIVCWTRGYALPPGWTSWGHLAVGGLLANVAPYFLFAVGEHLTSSAYAGILNGTTPLWTALTMTVVTRALPRRLQLAGLAIGFLGTVLIFEPWGQSATGTLAGVLACLAAAALYGVSYVYLARYVTSLPANPIAIATGQLAIAAVMSLVLVPIDGGRISSATPTAVLAVLVLGVAGTGLAYVLNYALLNAEGPTATSLVAYLIPVVAAVLGVLVLGDQLPPLAGAGAALVLVGVALVRRRPRSTLINEDP